jgi:hypothetical protein
MVQQVSWVIASDQFLMTPSARRRLTALTHLPRSAALSWPPHN